MPLRPAKVLQALLAIPPRPVRRACALCGHRVGRFIPYKKGPRGVPGLMTALEVIGSDVENFECPRCGAHDRERHVFLYLKASGLLDAMAGAAILHFAPEKRLARAIEARAPANYVKCDLYPIAPEIVRIDMLAIPYAAASFDFVIANHVLEHVDDDLRAVAELHRVLKVGGHAILQTPYSERLQSTWSDPGIDDDAGRLQAYGQADHVRLFGRDFVQRVASSGLVPRIGTHAVLLAGCDAREAGVNPQEPFLCFRREA